MRDTEVGSRPTDQAFTDPTFPPPMISGFEKYGHAWAMNPSELPMPHYDTDGTEGGGARA